MTRRIRVRAMGLRAVALAAGLAAAGGCASEQTADAEVETQQQALKETIDTFRSLVVTEQPILQRFSFQRVMDQLVAQSNVPGLTALALFRQWWDTQNPAGEIVVGGPACTGTLNTYPYVCRPRSQGQEGAEALSDPFTSPDTNPGAYIPIGLFNRFDLAPASGANCGEHRIVYARRSGITDNRNRNLIIFEATMPNPHPAQGLKGCDKIVKFWAGLTKTNNINKRADDLEDFYFRGIANYGDNASGVGQIRTNQFMQPLPIAPVVWDLREFKLLRTCAAGACSAMTVVPVTVKTNPFGGLFNAGLGDANKPAFDAYLVTQVEALAATSVAGIDMKMPDQFNSGHSVASGTAPLENDYVAQFAGGSDLRAALTTVLAGMSSTLTPDDIVSRARALSCAGCHRLNSVPTGNNLGGGLTWPASLGFTHVSEQAPVVGSDGVLRFQLSSALTDSFLPVRKQVMEDFLGDKPRNVKSINDPIGGRRVH